MSIPVRSSTLLLPLAEVRSTHIAGRCISCRTLVSMPLAAVIEHNPRAIVGHVAGRLRCERCGSRPSALVLIEDVAPTPSRDNIEIPKEIWMAADPRGVAVRGHVVAGNARCVSFGQEI